MKSHTILLSTLSLCFPILSYASTNCEDQITVLYHERIPYAITTSSSVDGLTATPAKHAFQQAGVEFHWQKTPVKRELLLIENNTGCLCSIGWFKNPARETFARYTAPIYQDKPQVAITSAQNESLQAGLPLQTAFNNKSLSLLVRDGYSYGKFIDQAIEQYQPMRSKVIYDNLKMLSLIYHQRYDYFFIAPEEINYLIASSKFKSSDFKIVPFNDIPDGEKRHIICNKNISEDTIRRLNSNIPTSL